LLAAKTERDQLIARQTDELAEKNALLQQAEAKAAEGIRRARLELLDTQSKLKCTEAKLDLQIWEHEEELVNVRAKLGAKESELEALRLRLTDTEKSLDVLVASCQQQVEQYERELTNVRAKFEAKESELEAVRLRLTDAEKGSSKGKAEILRCGQDTTGSVDRGEDQVTRRLMERVRAIEAEMASKRWNEKRIEDLECSNEKSKEEMEDRNEG
jgi:hypothetical protein